MAHKTTNGVLIISFDDISSSDSTALIVEIMKAAGEIKPDCSFSSNFSTHASINQREKDYAKEKETELKKDVKGK